MSDEERRQEVLTLLLLVAVVSGLLGALVGIVFALVVIA